jgi:hypothetical protein
MIFFYAGIAQAKASKTRAISAKYVFILSSIKDYY